MKKKSDFFSCQWICVLFVYWGLRILEKHNVAGEVGPFLTFVFVMGVGCIVIGIVGNDKEIFLISKRATKEVSISLILVLASEIIWALLSLVRFEKLDREHLLLATMTQYGLWVVFPVVFLLTEKKWIINMKGR